MLRAPGGTRNLLASEHAYSGYDWVSIENFSQSAAKWLPSGNRR